MSTGDIYRAGLVNATLALSMTADRPVLGRRCREGVLAIYQQSRVLLQLGEAPTPMSLIDWATLTRDVQGDERALAEAAIRAVAVEAQAAGLSRAEISAILSSQYLSHSARPELERTAS